VLTFRFWSAFTSLRKKMLFPCGFFFQVRFNFLLLIFQGDRFLFSFLGIESPLAAAGFFSPSMFLAEEEDVFSFLAGEPDSLLSV